MQPHARNPLHCVPKRSDDASRTPTVVRHCLRAQIHTKVPLPFKTRKHRCRDEARRTHCSIARDGTRVHMRTALLRFRLFRNETINIEQQLHLITITVPASSASEANTPSCSRREPFVQTRSTSWHSIASSQLASLDVELVQDLHE